MADDNKPVKYLRYAISEIILVMIGILLALQVNNQNEGRKTEILEREFLESLHSDLVGDTIMLNRRIHESKNIMKNHNHFVHQSYEIQDDFEGYLKLIDLLTWNSENFVFKNSTFNELSNSGLLNIFKNKEFKNSILSFYLDYEVAASHIREYNEYSVRELIRISPFLLKVAKWNNYIFDEPKMFKEYDQEFINGPSSQKFMMLEATAAAYSTKHKTFVDYYFEDLLSKSRLLINQIKNELKKRNWN